jgi:PAS domain S-box-containing protein
MPQPKAETPKDFSVEDSLPVMAWRARPDMSCEYLSRQWLVFTGVPADAALGDGWSRGMHPEDLARWLDTCLRAFDAREDFEIEYRLRRRDGEYRWVLDRGQPRYSRDGVFLGYEGVCVDVDDRKRAEAELARSLERERKLRISTEESSRLRDRFLAAVLHDLRSPVQAIATWAGHLRERMGRDSDATQALAAIERNAHAQNRLISDLLDLTRSAGGMPMQRAMAEAPLLGGVRVLVVDEDPGARHTMLKVLNIAGAEARPAACGEALEALRNWRPDLLLSGVDLHNGEGLALIRQLRALPADQGGGMRAAALTPAARPQDGLRAVAAGYNAQLSKPVEPVALLATVTRLVQPAGAR